MSVYTGALIGDALGESYETMGKVGSSSNDWCGHMDLYGCPQTADLSAELDGAGVNPQSPSLANKAIFKLGA